MTSLTGEDRSLRRVVADNMHPWLVADGGLMVMPPESEILAAADRLIEGLRKQGYRIVKDP